jgi:hypothetical protein
MEDALRIEIICVIERACRKFSGLSKLLKITD